METGKELSSEEQVQLANVDETCKEIEESSKAQELRNSPEGEAVIDTVLPDGWTCRACGQQNAPGEDKCTNKNCAVIDERLEVENNNLITEYPTFHDFETKILQEAYSVSANTRIRKKCGKNRDWQPLNIFSRGTVLERFVAPIKSTSNEFIFYGIAFIALLKAIDTTIFLFTVHPGLGFFWLVSIVLFVASIFNKVSLLLGIGAIIFMQIKFGIQFNVFVTFLTIVLIGVILGIPLGMAVGAVVGFIREKRGMVLFDALPEKRIVLVKRFIIPLLIFTGLSATYLLVLNPLIIKWLSKE